MSTQTQILIREARETDLEALHALETSCFASDRLSRRRLRHWIQARNREFLVADHDGRLLGYGLVLFHGKTRLARLYSLAVDSSARGTGLGRSLLQALEAASAHRGRLFMRLEVAQDNQAAILLYQQSGYVIFGTYEKYYEDQRNAVRMQKLIRYAPTRKRGHIIPWYQQTTRFTCGPAALMMAMAGLNKKLVLDQQMELDIWREATTIFMTSGHGGCHPLGLALAAEKRGFKASVYINQSGPLFLEGVRSNEKKEIIALVHHQFVAQAHKTDLSVHYQEISQQEIETQMQDGAMVLVLVSSYRLDRKKAPHWVLVTAMDEECLYVHDPDPSLEEQTGLDCADLPIARQDFSRMSQFGRDRLRTAVIIRAAKPGKR
ncbi:MAG: GNAT family N-acetyltransferase/peptidase C39 family protein [Pseudomonadales bacterium]|nr:GNAT family N-acetyltransferase/peptidase C39 family protein [Pseudomonadales bacterium]